MARKRKKLTEHQKAVNRAKSRIKSAEKKGYVFSQSFKDKVERMTTRKLNELKRGILTKEAKGVKDLRTGQEFQRYKGKNIKKWRESQDITETLIKSNRQLLEQQKQERKQTISEAPMDTETLWEMRRAIAEEGLNSLQGGFATMLFEVYTDITGHVTSYGDFLEKVWLAVENGVVTYSELRDSKRWGDTLPMVARMSRLDAESNLEQNKRWNDFQSSLDKALDSERDSDYSDFEEGMW